MTPAQKKLIESRLVLAALLITVTLFQHNAWIARGAFLPVLIYIFFNYENLKATEMKELSPLQTFDESRLARYCLVGGVVLQIVISFYFVLSGKNLGTYLDGLGTLFLAFIFPALPMIFLNQRDVFRRLGMRTLHVSTVGSPLTGAERAIEPRYRGRATYGHVSLSIFFRPLLSLDEEGFTVKGRRYGWSDVERVRVWQLASPGVGYMPDAKLLPRADVHLTDGQVVHIRGEVLEKRGPALASGYNTAFDELVSLFQEKLRERREPLGWPSKGVPPAA
jgi:hypothetical protein